MSNAMELLSTEVCDDILNVDLESRKIVIPNTVQNLGVESDDSVRVLHFQVPRYYCEVDLSTFVIRINYKHASGAGGYYDISTPTVEENLIKFDWKVARQVVVKKGNVLFNVCFREFTGSTVTREFNTTVATLPVLEGLKFNEDYVGTPDTGADGDVDLQAYVECVPQNLTFMQKAYARSNIDAGDDLEFDTTENKLYLLSAGKRISEGIALSYSGGGGGSAGSNNAEMTMQNTTGWIYKTISSGSSCPISFVWSSTEDEMSTGAGVLKITNNNSQKYLASVDQGTVVKDIGPYLSPGINNVSINVVDVYGNSRLIRLTITAVALSLTSNFDNTIPYTGAFSYIYTPTGSAVKTVYFKVDGKEIGTATVTTSGRQQTQTIPAQAHGSHTLEVYFTAVINDAYVESNHLFYDIICLEENNTTPVIASDFNATNAEQYASIVITYRVYSPNSLTSEVTLEANDEVVNNLTVDRTIQTWTYRADAAGVLKLKISCGDAVPKTFNMDITESQIKVEAETDSLALYLTSYGRSNSESDPAQWSSGDVSAVFSGFNFVSDGWVPDDDGITALRVSGDARLTIPYHIFRNDFRTTGKTIEVEFASRDVLNYDAVIMSCMSGGRGLEITAQQAFLTSLKSSIGTRYKEDEHVRLTFVVEKKSGNKLLMCYINGILSGAALYPDDDDFSQGSSVGISIGSNDCTIDLYNIRIYDNDLTRYQILDNWIADTQIAAEKNARWERNSIYDDYGQIVIDNLPQDLPYLVIECPVLPAFKDDKKTCSGYYVDPAQANNNFRFDGAQIDVQGTSSQYYYVKNWKIKFKGGFILTDGSTVETYQMNDKAVPTDTFTFKADVASSEGANNVVLAQTYNDLCPTKTPPQVADPRVRQTIDGHPIVIFWDNGDGPVFAGKYNFNNDKGTEEVFGFETGDESWEIKENGTDRVGFKSADYSDDSWQTEFEARYPDGSTDIERFAEFAAWVNSTYTEEATGDALPEAVTYNDVEYTHDTTIYRLEKFRNELPDWADVDALVFYYLFTLVFLCIDQREKNAFPTFFNDMGKWLVFFYDADSSLGTDNKGNLAFDYWLEDIDFTEAGDPVFNGQGSVLWSNLRATYWPAIEAMYKELRTTIRTDGSGLPLLSYNTVDGLFEAHQDKWPEAIFNEDGFKKSIEPYEVQGATIYLPMLQGKKEQFRKWWLYNRFRYMDSLFCTGSSMEKRITMRAHAQADITLTSYVNMYGHVYYNSLVAGHRMFRGVPQTFEWAASGAEDPVIGINDADMLTSLGDLSPLMIELIDASLATHLTSLKLGDASDDYVNDNLNSVTMGNNTLLKSFDARNCVKLAIAADLSGCTNIEEVYFDGTAITSCKLPNGGNLKVLHLPGTVVGLTVRNQKNLTEFVLPSYSQLETLRLENNSDAIPARDILDAMPANSRVRLIGFDWSFSSKADLQKFYNRLETMRGLDEGDGNMNKAQVAGTVRVDKISEPELSGWNSNYPNVTVVYEELLPSTFVQLVERTYEGVYTNDRITVLGQQAFSGYAGITEFYFPSVVTMNYAAFNRVAAKKVVLPALKTAGAAFVSASSLEYVDMGLLTGSFSYAMFSQCPKLATIIFRSTEAVAFPEADSAISTTLVASGTGYIYVPASMIDAYKAHAKWATYVNQFRAIEDYPDIVGGEQ